MSAKLPPETWQRQDARMRARVDGREDKARRIVWQITIGPLAFRCLCLAPGRYIVQARCDKGWQDLPPWSGPDPEKLFQDVTAAPRILEQITTRAKEIQR